MKRVWTILIASLATAGIANAAEIRPVDLNSLDMDPLEILQALAPARQGRSPADQRQMEMPKACTDAAITDAQKTAIESAVYDAELMRIRDTAEFNVAQRGYAHTVMDMATDKAAADAASAKIVDGVHKLVANHLTLANKVLYDLVTPAQRKNTFMCIMAMHKMKKNQKHQH
jgi:hypothetical protein